MSELEPFTASMGVGCSRRAVQKRSGDPPYSLTKNVTCRAMPPRCKIEGCDRLQNLSTKYCCTVCSRGDAALLGHTRQCDHRVDKIWSSLKENASVQPAGDAALGQALERVEGSAARANELRGGRLEGDPPSLLMTFIDPLVVFDGT